MSRPEPRLTIVDVAREAGVSFKTVSRVINHDRAVNAETRASVEAVIARLNFRPNVRARVLRSSQSRLIALACSEAGNTYVNQIQASIMAACQSAGYHLVVEQLGRHRALPHIRKFTEALRLDGVVLVPPVADHPNLVAAMKTAGIPFVRISPFTDQEASPYVRIDNKRAAYRMTEYLLELGHRDIGFVKGPEESGAAQERYAGFVQAMERHKGNLRPQWTVQGAYTAHSGMEAGAKLLATPVRPSAVFACNDEMAMGVMFAAFRRGLVPPRDLSIAGFDDMPISSELWPSLTTIRQPVVDLARVATELLIEKIRAPDVPDRGRYLAFKLVVRESTAPYGR